MKRTVAIGDVHGCLSLLERLLDRLNYEPASDHLVFVGDLIDRGPQPAAVVRLVRTLAEFGHCVVMRGNHEEKAINFLTSKELAEKSGKPNNRRPVSPTRLAEWEELSPEDLKWLRGLPDYKEVAPGWLAVHAGFEDVPLKDQRSDKVTRVRALDEKSGKFRSTEPGKPDPPGSVTWMSRWKGPQNVVYGHAVHGLDAPRVDTPVPGVETWGIDTGACYGGNLTALDLTTKEVFQVRDGRVYAKLYSESGRDPDT